MFVHAYVEGVVIQAARALKMSVAVANTGAAGQNIGGQLRWDA